MEKKLYIILLHKIKQQKNNHKATFVIRAKSCVSATNVQETLTNVFRQQLQMSKAEKFIAVIYLTRNGLTGSQ